MKIQTPGACTAKYFKPVAGGRDGDGEGLEHPPPPTEFLEVKKQRAKKNMIEAN